MKFTAREDIEAPIEFVFSQVTDFAALERSALRRGAEVQRVDDLEVPGPGMAWDAAFTLRGKRREVQIELTEFDPPNGIVVGSRSPNMGGHLVVDLVALSRGRTRLGLDLEMQPKTLAAKLLIQSMKLAKSNLTKRFKLRVADYAKDLEERYKSQA
jgi:hypothetical protein